MRIRQRAAAGDRHAAARSPKKSDITRTEELQLIIQESQEAACCAASRAGFCASCSSLATSTAGQVMVPRVHLVAIRVGTTADELRDIVRTRPHTRYPVHTGDPDNIVGSVHIKDLLRHFVLGSAGQPIATPVLFLTSRRRCRSTRCWRRCGAARAQMAVVMDEHGGTAGIVTIEDLFEEVVGEIDEGRGRTPIWRDPSGRLLVRGTVRLEGCRRRDRPVARTSGGADDQRPRAGAARTTGRVGDVGDLE